MVTYLILRQQSHWGVNFIKKNLKPKKLGPTFNLTGRPTIARMTEDLRGQPHSVATVGSKNNMNSQVRSPPFSNKEVQDEDLIEEEKDLSPSSPETPQGHPRDQNRVWKGLRNRIMKGLRSLCCCCSATEEREQILDSNLAMTIVMMGSRFKLPFMRVEGPWWNHFYMKRPENGDSRQITELPLE
ncbi:hypothetical protein A6R68_07143, partial [Neotoma lepida]